MASPPPPPQTPSPPPPPPPPTPPPTYPPTAPNETPQHKRTLLPGMQREAVPLDFGRPFTPYPLPCEHYNFSNTLRWLWFPGFRWDLRFLLTATAAVCSLIAIILVFVSIFLPGARPPAYVFVAFSTLLVLLRVNIALNQSRREAVCRAMAKRDQALALWQAAPGPPHEGKDVFFNVRGFGTALNVLRDGSVEVAYEALDEKKEREDAIVFGVDTTGSVDPSMATKFAEGNEKNA